VRRAQKAAQRLSRDGFFVVVFGDANHPEVKGILGWADGHGIATRDANELKKFTGLPGRVGILSQTTQISTDFIRFAKDVLDAALVKDSEIRIVDTICHETRHRQASTLGLARKSDLMIVVGGRNSANTRHLYMLCSELTDTEWVETADEIRPEKLEGKKSIGITAGTSTDERTIEEVTDKLENSNNIPS
jgi:4-hydroxy-3-methylbut-2-enyl diphosphate reductase